MLNSYHNKSVIITGITGFKGSWLALWLKKLGANVLGVSLPPVTQPSFYEIADLSVVTPYIHLDICNMNRLSDVFTEVQPDYVFHLAAQSIVATAFERPMDTWMTNACGTVSVLEALRVSAISTTCIVITSDKCYENREWLWGYREDDRLGGSDLYSASKAAAEIAFRAYYRSFFSDCSLVRMATARAGNVIGGGDWSRGRIVPDCIGKWSMGEEVTIRNPESTRPWQHVLEPLSGYLQLALELDIDRRLSGESFNFGPSSETDQTVSEIVERLSLHWGAAKWRTGEEELGRSSLKESRLLKLDCDKARQQMKWKSCLSLEKTLEMTASWYKAAYGRDSDKVLEETFSQIEYYSSVANRHGLRWAQ